MSSTLLVVVYLLGVVFVGASIGLNERLDKYEIHLKVCTTLIWPLVIFLFVVAFTLTSPVRLGEWLRKRVKEE